MDLNELLATLDRPIMIRPARRMTQAELESYLDKTADILRGNADQSEYVVNAATGQVIFTPPSVVEVPIIMSELVKWLNGDLDIHPVLRSGIAQFQLVHIHPFLDGTGRTSRLLSTLCLYKAGYDFKRLFTISEYYDRDRPAFYRAIQGVRESGKDLLKVEGATNRLVYFLKT
jgi:Fic family protein